MANVSKSFGDNHVLRNFLLKLRWGENVVVLGKSGSGKSVLIKCIIGLLAVDAGQITVLGQDVATLDHATPTSCGPSKGPACYLLTDTAFAGRMRHATRQLASTSDTLAHTLAGLKRQIQPPNTLLADKAMGRNLRQSLRNVELGTAGFSKNMDALKHNFLLRGYFRKQARTKPGRLRSDHTIKIARHAERSRSISTAILNLSVRISCAVEVLRLRSA